MSHWGCGEPDPSSYERIYEVVREIPYGQVATYGQVAALAGLPGHARQVGYAMAALRTDSDVPWQRVINAKGEVSPRKAPGGDVHQRILLEQEGVEFNQAGKIDLRRYRWDAEDPDPDQPSLFS